jgi:hypothetical protein
MVMHARSGTGDRLQTVRYSAGCRLQTVRYSAGCRLQTAVTAPEPVVAVAIKTVVHAKTHAKAVVQVPTERGGASEDCGAS